MLRGRKPSKLVILSSSLTMSDTVRRLVEVEWDQIEYGVFDVIQSYLVEHPDSYYMAPTEQWLCYLTREFGLLMLVEDFSAMSEEDIEEYITGALELLYK